MRALMVRARAVARSRMVVPCAEAAVAGAGSGRVKGVAVGTVPASRSGTGSGARGPVNADAVDVLVGVPAAHRSRGNRCSTRARMNGGRERVVRRGRGGAKRQHAE